MTLTGAVGAILLTGMFGTEYCVEGVRLISFV